MLTKIFQSKVDQISFLFALLATIAFIFFAEYLWQYGDHENNFKASMAIVSAMLIWLPRFLRLWPSWRKIVSPTIVGFLEVGTVVLLYLNGLGALGWYKNYKYYDMIVHFVTPFLFAGMISVLVGAYLWQQNNWQMRYAHFMVVVFMMMLIVWWEWFEYSGDGALNTHMFEQANEKYDTWYDIGVGVGAVLLLSVVNQFKLKKIILWFYAHDHK